MNAQRWSRRRFVLTGLNGLALSSVPAWMWTARAGAEESTEPVRAVVREPTLFAGIRKPLTDREQLAPRIAALERACAGEICGPLTHIYRFDTPVEGFDSEIGFPVTGEVTSDEIITHRLRRMHFYSKRHRGPMATVRETAGQLYTHMNTTGLSPELELVEVFHDHPKREHVQVMASFLAWPEVYREQLERVLGAGVAATVWRGGEAITPETAVDPRCAWVGTTLERLKQHSSVDQQFDILSRVALRRPIEDIEPYRAVYEQTQSVDAVLKAHADKLKAGRTGGPVGPWSCTGTHLCLSKVPYNRKGYDAASSDHERRAAYCFCNLIRNASDPKVDPIFCYRAAGWARQMWERVLDVELTHCEITHSILAGDPYCAWRYTLPSPPAEA